MSKLHQPIYRGNVETDPRNLPSVARRIFSETFGHLFEAQAFANFCDVAYGDQGTMVAAEAMGQPIAYAKVTPLNTPASKPKPGAMELQQLYVLSEWHGKGVAEELIRWSIDAAVQQGAPELYLTVFDHNERAKRFYRRHGFFEVGRCTPTLGGEDHDNRIWSKSL